MRLVGRASVYALADAEIEELLAAAEEAVLDATGNAAAPCPSYGAPP